MKFWNYATGEPWAIDEPVLNNLLSIVTRDHKSPDETIEAISSRVGKDLDHHYKVEVHDGVAVLPVTGPLFRYANLFTAISGATSYELLAKDFAKALSDPAITSIIFDIDSPGGEVNGCAELARMIYVARGKKPIIAYASGDIASGAYWLASACDEIVVSDTSMVGSIGVVAVYRSGNKQNTIEVVSSQSPHKRLDPEKDEDRSRLQNRIDDLASVFIDAIAKHRGVDPPTVKSSYGKGDVFIGTLAVKSGLADRTGSLDQLITEYSLQNEPYRCSATDSLVMEQGNLDEDISMPKKETVEDSGNANAESTQQAPMSVSYLTDKHPGIVKAIQDETVASCEAGFADRLNATATEAEKLTISAVETERARIGAIVGADEAKGREELAKHLAFSTEMSAEMALATLKASPAKSTESTGSGFEQAMADMTNPDIEPDDGESEGVSADMIAKRIAQFGANQGGAA